jgi:hypothetical protein
MPKRVEGILPLCTTAAQLAKYPNMKRLERCE